MDEKAKSSPASPTTMVRSSLEAMLENIRRRDSKPKDLPPALPSRPTSRGRLPSSRRSLPTDLRINEDETDGNRKDAKGKSDDVCKNKAINLVKMKIRSNQLKGDCPYNCRDSKTTVAGDRSGDSANVSSTSRPVVDWDENIEYFIKKKLSIWCRLSSGQWESGIIQSTSGEKASVRLLTGNVVTVSTGELLPANPDILEGVDNLIQLSYLNEPSVLHNLHHRYVGDMIYSKAGPILIAFNPFKDVQIYGNSFIKDYREKLVDSPHVYAVSDAAYDEMTKDGVNQSIIVSGESGAGKTETAKIAMQYLAALGGGENGIEHEILQTSSILESFGNAKTCRNDNSSRFGKLIEIHFSNVGKMCGAAIQTFLLEKSRVVQLAEGERSYHAFYQLCSGALPILRERLNIKAASDYYYLNQSSCLSIDGVDDAQNYHKLMEALDIVRINKEDQEGILSILAAVLWLGNIKFEAIDNENNVEVVADEAVTSAAKLIGCSEQDLIRVLSTRNIKAGRDSIVKKLTVQQATDSRDALAKFIYASLFDWLVDQLNKSLAAGKWHTGRAINILDIYGFESFQRNSFEQLCINYANERLQQHFNRHLFKLEQELRNKKLLKSHAGSVKFGASLQDVLYHHKLKCGLNRFLTFNIKRLLGNNSGDKFSTVIGQTSITDYEADGIDWTRVEFQDNQECINLFEKKPLGLLSLLDEESNFPKATDLTFADKLKQHLSSNSCFKGQRDKRFSIHHYAGEVSYDTAGFLEKNRDPLPSESIRVLLSSSCPLLHSFASNILNAQSDTMGSQKHSVGTKFKGQLYKLMQRLESTTPHFIRCIKPNSRHLPGAYDEDLVAQQLKCCGVLEVVRIARAGYPSRYTHQEFAQRYGFLLLDKDVPQDPLSISVAVLQQFNIMPGMYQVGFTKLYFRTGQIGGLENMRKQFLESVVCVQKFFRGSQARGSYHDYQKGVSTLQSFIRGELARRKYTYLYKKHKAGTSQKRRHKHSASRDKLQKAILLQSVVRGWLTRKRLDKTQSLESVNFDSADTDENPINRTSEGEVPPLDETQVQGQLAKPEARSRHSGNEPDSTQENNQSQSSVLNELKRRLEKAEATLERKEEENIALKAQLRHYEKRRSEYEAKIGSMEEMWNKQKKSLQASLAAAKKSLTPERASGQPGKRDSSPYRSSNYYDAEDNLSPVHETGANTPNKSPIRFLPEASRGRELNGNSNPIFKLAKEFEQNTKKYVHDLNALLDDPTANPEEQRKLLKSRFGSWSKEYKRQLKETKGILQKISSSEAERRGKNWWGRLSQKIT